MEVYILDSLLRRVRVVDKFKSMVALPLCGIIWILRIIANTGKSAYRSVVKR